MFLLVPAYPGCPGSKAVKRSLLFFVANLPLESVSEKKFENRLIFGEVMGKRLDFSVVF